jgi:heme iron utilization protein
MAQVNKSPEMPAKSEIAAAARALLRRAFKGTLATIDTRNDYPYASLITVATDAAGAPSFLISKLARHTANLARDRRASILVDETGGLADALQGARLTLTGMAEPVAGEAIKRRFLARHPEAELYVGFPDFGFWRLNIEGIFDLEPSDLLVTLAGAESLLEAEPGIVEHMNEDHADALELYATALGDGEPGAWRMTGIDPEGFDIVLGGAGRRIPFAQPVATPAEARTELVRLVAEARAGRQ